MKLTIGAYPIYPNPAQPELGSATDIVRELSADNRVCGFEIPYKGPDAGPYWNGTWPEGAATGTAVVITGIPYTMGRQDSNPGLGLASPDEDMRQAALALNRELNECVHQIHAHGGTVAAVQLHSAPRHGGCADAFARSLAEVCAWDWDGATLAVEHCDAEAGTVKPEKAFLSFEDELAAIRRVYNDMGDEVAEGAHRNRLGVSINWARSVLETGDPDTPVQQLRTAREAGLLRGFMLSGIDPEDSLFGPAWVDGHLSPVGMGGAAPSSLLTAERMAESWLAAGEDLVFKGFKMSLRPDSLTVAQRLDVYSAVMDMLDV